MAEIGCSNPARPLSVSQMLKYVADYFRSWERQPSIIIRGMSYKTEQLVPNCLVLHTHLALSESKTELSQLLLHKSDHWDVKEEKTVVGN